MQKSDSLFFKFSFAMGGILLFLFLITMTAGCSNTKQEANQQTALQKDLNISICFDSQFLQLAVKKYQKAHQDVSIHLNPLATDGDRDQYAQVINTSIMSGKADDIIDVSPLSFWKLADKNMLVDLDEFLGKDLASENYFTDVLDAYRYKGKQYTLPLSFVIEAYQMDERVSKALGITKIPSHLTLDDLLSFSQPMPKDGKNMLFDNSAAGMSDVTLAYRLFSLDMKKYVDLENKKVNFNNEDFISLLEKVKSLNEKKQMATEKGYKNKELFYTSDTQSLLHIYNLYSPAMCQSGTVAYSNLIPLTNQEGFSTLSNTEFMPAISQNSKNKELAADFIKFLLSQEMQTSPELLYCPVNKNAVAVASQFIYEDSKAGGYLPAGFDETTLQQNIEKHNELAKVSTMLDYFDRNIRNFVMAEMTHYFAGEESAEQSAKNLETKINTYLKE